MKFHRLELKNLNSLYGEHTIDFDDDLGKPPLFLIRGPTGSGKTTILDAICLALFGTTPRLKEISSTAERCAKILSNGEGRAHVKLDFSLRDNSKRRYFRARWEFWRSYDKPQGTPQDPRRSLSEIDAAGEEIANLVNSKKQTAYDNAFDEVLRGLTVDDFFRSVMLAQNQFAAFLKADEEEKASILESLTRTDRYQQIGKVAAGKWFERRDAIDEQKTRIQTLADHIPEDENLEEIQKKLDGLEEEKEKLREKLETEKKCLKWLETLEQLQARKKELLAEKEVAEKAHKAKSDDFETLEAAQSVEAGREPLRTLENHEEELEELRQKVEGLQKRRDELAEVVQKLEGQKEKRESARKAAQKKLYDGRPKIKEGRKLETTLKNLQESLDKGNKQLKQREKQLEKLQKEKKDTEKRLNDLGDELQKAEKSLGEKEHLHDLPEKFAGLKERVSSASDEARRVQSEAEGLSNLAEELEATTKQIDTLRSQLKVKEEELKPLTAALKTAKEKTQSLQADAESLRQRRKELRESRDGLNKEVQTLEKCAESIGSVEEHRKALAARKEAIKAKKKTQKVLADQVAEHKKAQETVDGQIKTLQEEIGRLKVAWEVHQYRLHLETENGASCPVCGSTEHPLLLQQSAEELHTEEKSKLQELEKEYRELTEEKKELEEAISNAEKKTVKLASELENEEKRASEDRQTIARLNEDISGNLDALDTSLGAAVDAALDADKSAETLIDAAKEERKEELQRLDQTLDKIDEAEESFEEKQKAVKQAEKRLDAKKSKLDTLETRHGEKAKERDRRSEEFAEKRSDLAENLKRLADRFDDFNVKTKFTETLGDEPADDLNVDCQAIDAALDEALEAAKEKKVSYEALAAKVEKLKKEASELNTALKNQNERIKDADEELEKAGEYVKEQNEKVEETRETLDELLQGRVLDEWEKGLESAFKEADQAVVDLRQELKDKREKHASAEASFKANQQNIADRKKKVVEAMQKLAKCLQKLPVDGRKALAEALMDPDALEALRKECQKVKNELENARKLHKKAETELETHDENRPEALAEEAKKVDIQEAVDELSMRVDAITEKIGDKKRTLDEGKKRQKNLRKAKKELARLDKEAAPWERLHKLIGRGSGKHFKLFAQSLNLGEIIRRANEHLQRLEERYKLAIKRDENRFPTLEFEVIDRYLANQRRSLETLSGGETFLVSLALSLALADNKRLDLPIETIFLDEGFGTLDQEALQTAMNCLNQLHYRGGRTVGVISHVEALHRDGGISHQVVLETLRDGVSKIRINRP